MKFKLSFPRWTRYSFYFVIMLFIGPCMLLLSCSVNLTDHWSVAPRGTATMAPSPQTTPEAIIQVYAARAYNWRGLFAVHMWIAVKPERARYYTTHQVIGWRAYRGGSAVVSGIDTPDRYWFGNKPELIKDIRGTQAANLIPKIEKAVKSYPYAYHYRAWPGPNSNTFIAHVARQVPELELALPPHAIGKDYVSEENIFNYTPSGTGYQLSLLGLLGISVAEKEGFEVNILGLTFGFDLLGPAIKLPGVGRVGWKHHDVNKIFSLEPSDSQG